MLFLKTSLMLLLLLAPTIVLTDCPDFTFRCPSGESFRVNTCWDWSRFQCQTCRSIISDMKSRCPMYSCGGSAANWYGRNDGCSAAFVTGAMTEVFRAACAIHDICYATPGRTQRQCDNEFRHNMQETCKFPGINTNSIRACYLAANIAYDYAKARVHSFPAFTSTCTLVE